jgi:hypothetical protein
MAEANEFTQAVAPDLARALAGASDCAFVTWSTFYVVCRWTSANVGTSPISGDFSLDPFDVQDPVETWADASTLLQSLPNPAAYGIFGPFQNTYIGFGAPPPDQATIDGFEVTASGPNAGPPFFIAGDSCDAMFWSLESVQKFVIPYYVQEYGTAFGADLMQQYYDAEFPLVVHLPWSEYEALDPAGKPAIDAQVASNGSKPRRGGKRIPGLVHRGPNGKARIRPVFPTRPAA